MQLLFKEISFTFSDKDRIGLLGPNGAGKSTLLKILANEEKPDSGHIVRRQGLRIGYSSQDPEFPPQTLEEILQQHSLANDPVERLTRARILLGKAQFVDSTLIANALSGGWKKRLDIVKAFMHHPDFILLDEPTNHLDLEGILWLEKFLQRENVPYAIVSHDRTFLENVCNKIMELNRCFPSGLFVSEGDMQTYVERREAFLTGQAQRERGLASVVRHEVDWLKRSPKARTTKSRSRVSQAHELMDELSNMKQRNKIPKVDLGFSASERETKKLLVAKGIKKCFGEKELFKGINVTLSPGSRLGIVGKNGTGKTTFLKILAGMIPQDQGTIKYADDLQLVYFDQHREQIPLSYSLKQALSPTGDYVDYHGQQIHVNGWAKKFLFPEDKLELPISYLSGGERARILIARLMLKPADILFLDEPTNDLDIPTLEVIEENLLDFAGAVVLISHDRSLMDRVCNQILDLQSDAEHQFYASYSQWEMANQKINAPKKTEVVKTQEPVINRPKKLSYHEQKELEGMENKILQAETKVTEIQKLLEDPDTYSDSKKSLDLYRSLGDAQKNLEMLFSRWQELIDKQN